MSGGVVDDRRLAAAIVDPDLGDLAVPVIVYSTYRKDVQADEGL